MELLNSAQIINNKKKLFGTISHIHSACHKLCMQSMGRYLPAAGNVGVFCHFADEYLYLKKLQSELTDLSKSVYGKYFLLHEPIVIPSNNDIPEATYKYLYIRKPDPNKPQVGDIDFYLEPEKYIQLKKSLVDGKIIKGVRTLPYRPDLDLVELYNDNFDVLAYIGDKNWK